jgi:hypothetical protein
VAGRYTVAYRIVSADGHPVSRRLGFVLAAGSSAPATGTPSAVSAPPTASPAASPQDGSARGWLAGHRMHVLLGAVVVGAGVAVLWRDRRRAR